MTTRGPRAGAGALSSRTLLIADALALFAVWLFLAGGIHVRWPLGPWKLELDFGRFGLFFLPLIAICGFRPAEAARLRSVAAVRWAAHRIGRLSAAQRRGLVLGSLGVIAGFQLAGIFSRYFAFQASMDLAIYANACKGGLYSTMKGDVWLFADHFEPSLALLAPLCRVLHPSKVVLVAQWAAWLVGAFGIQRLARHHRWSPATAWLLAALYLQMPGFATTVMYDFHLLALALGALPWLWLWAAQGRWLPFWLCVIFVWGLKENTALTMAAFGGFLLLSRLDAAGRAAFGAPGPQPWSPAASLRACRVNGALLAGLSLLLFALIMKRVYPHFRAGEGTMYFAKYYGHLGNTMGEFVTTALTRPFYFAASFVTPRKLSYLFLLLAPFAALPLLRPLWLLPALPAVFINVASNHSNLLRAKYHYEAEIFPLLFCATTALVMTDRARAWFVRHRLPCSPRGLWLAVLLVFYSGDGLGYFSAKHRPAERHLYLEAKLAELVPRDASVAANQMVAAHLTDRRRLYMMDYLGMEDDWRRAELIVIAYPWEHLGWYPAEEFERDKVPAFAREFALAYRDPVYPDFRIWKRRK